MRSYKFTGSNPVLTIIGRLAEWSNVLDLKSSVQQCTVGSNPTSSAIKRGSEAVWYIFNPADCRKGIRRFRCVRYITEYPKDPKPLLYGLLAQMVRAPHS